VQKNGSWISQQFMVLQNNWMSDHWENVTDNVEALLIWLLSTSSKVSEGTPQMLITSLDFSAFTGRIAIGRLKRCFKRRNANLISKKR
jgi:GTP-binding protein